MRREHNGEYEDEEKAGDESYEPARFLYAGLSLAQIMSCWAETAAVPRIISAPVHRTSGFTETIFDAFDPGRHDGAARRRIFLARGASVANGNAYVGRPR